MREIFKENKKRILKANLQILNKSSLVSVALSTLLCVASFLVSSIQKNRNLYLSMFFLFGFVCFGSHTIAKKNDKWIMPLFYVFLIIAFAVAIILGTFLTPNNTATTLSVLLFALPLLIIDRPIRISFLISGVGVVFCVISYMIKPSAVAAIDIVNVVSFLFLSIFVNYFVLKTKLSDIDNRKKLEWERDTDNLTQLYNRGAIRQMIEGYIETTDKAAALMIVDVDNFKQVNDTQGHSKGDEVLCRIADSMRNVLREGDVIGRYGGDEFIAFLIYVNDEENARRKAEEMIHEFQGIFEQVNEICKVSGSIGIALYPNDAKNYDKLFKKADQALYVAKENGKSQSFLYSQIKG